MSMFAKPADYWKARAEAAEAELYRLRVFLAANSFEISGECGIGFEIVADDRLHVGAKVCLLPESER